MVLAQRLGRRLCAKCKQPVTVERKRLLEIGFTEEQIDKPGFQLYGPKGCAVCNGRGYKGRVGFFELLEVTTEVAQAIQAQVSEEELRKTAVQSGMYTLRNAAILKAIQGVTSLEEVEGNTVIQQDTLPPYLVSPPVEEYEDGDIIIQEGNQDDRNFYKLVRGKVAVLKQGKKIAEITEPGEYFGEMALLDGHTAPATVIAMEDSEIGLLTKEEFDKFLLTNEKIRQNIINILCKRLRDAWLMIKIMSFASAEQRILAVLDNLKDVYGVKDQRGTIINLKLTHKEIASYAAVSRETASRALGKLVKDNVIESFERKYILKDAFFTLTAENKI